MNLVSLKNVTKTYRSVRENLVILDDLSLEVNEGESVFIGGQSGSGKSTLLNIVGGLDFFDAGHLFSCGLELNALNEKALTEYRKKSIGFIFQFHYLLRDFTALENITLVGLIKGSNQKAYEKRAKELLNKIGLYERRDHYPHQLSGGERQRVAVARALVDDPMLLLADEPTGSLDEKHAGQVGELVYSLVHEMKKTMILVSHDARLACEAMKRYNLEQGKLSSL